MSKIFISMANNVFLGITLLLLHFRKIIVVGFSLGNMTYIVTGSWAI